MTLQTRFWIGIAWGLSTFALWDGVRAAVLRQPVSIWWAFVASVLALGMGFALAGIGERTGKTDA